MSYQSPPFIYIAALMRTGSTLISEMLTRVPQSFIFREPHIGKNDFQPKPGDVEMLQACGINLARILLLRRYIAFLHRRLRLFGWPQDYMVRVLKNCILESMPLANAQIGVKEIRNQGWENYWQHFPDMKVILTGRDPRDIYISTYYHRRRQGKEETVSPQAIANELKKEFRVQLQIDDRADCLQVRYEDLCQDTTIVDEVKDFVKSPISKTGRIGQFNVKHPIRWEETQVHGGQITAKCVSRWRNEDDTALVQDAKRCFRLMPAYVEFWKYKL